MNSYLDAMKSDKSVSSNKVFWKFLKRFSFAYGVMCLLVFFVWINEGNPPKNSLFQGRFADDLLATVTVFDFLKVVFVHTWYVIFFPMILTPLTWEILKKKLGK